MLALWQSFLLTSENQTLSTSSKISKRWKWNFKNLRGSQLVMRWPVICWLRLLLPLLLLFLQSWSHLIRYSVSRSTSLLWKSKSKTCWVPRVKDPPVWKLEKNEIVSLLRNFGLQPQQRDKCLVFGINSFDIFEYSLYTLFTMGSHVLPHIARFNKSFLANLSNLTLRT